MKKAFIGTALASCLALAASPAFATDLIWEGIHYNLNEDNISADGKTASFTLTISGENTAADLEGGTGAGRTGINAIALTDPTTGNAISGVMTGFAFNPGGLSSTGCDGSGNFFCFDNTSIPPTPGTALSGLITLMFTVTSDTTGSWLNYAPAFKIDWVGSHNNYDLVSQLIALNTVGCPDCGPGTQIAPSPEPATWMTMILGFAFIGNMLRRKRGAAIRRVRLA